VPYFDLMRRAFIPRRARTGESFEFFDDNHWNGMGHGVAAEAAPESKRLARLRQ